MGRIPSAHERPGPSWPGRGYFEDMRLRLSFTAALLAAAPASLVAQQPTSAPSTSAPTLPAPAPTVPAPTVPAPTAPAPAPAGVTTPVSNASNIQLDRVVAVVGDVVITQSDLRERIIAKRQEGQPVP